MVRKIEDSGSGEVMFFAKCLFGGDLVVGLQVMRCMGLYGPTNLWSGMDVEACTCLAEALYRMRGEVVSDRLDAFL